MPCPGTSPFPVIPGKATCNTTCGKSENGNGRLGLYLPDGASFGIQSAQSNILQLNYTSHIFLPIRSISTPQCQQFYTLPLSYFPSDHLSFLKPRLHIHSPPTYFHRHTSFPVGVGCTCTIVAIYNDDRLFVQEM